MVVQHTYLDHSSPAASLWNGQRRVAKDPYRCPNAQCRCHKPRGFTARVTCGAKFAFEIIIGPSKVEKITEGTNAETKEATPRSKRLWDEGLLATPSDWMLAIFTRPWMVFYF